jgi:hypothetical protein
MDDCLGCFWCFSCGLHYGCFVDGGDCFTVVGAGVFESELGDSKGSFSCDEFDALDYTINNLTVENTQFLPGWLAG